MFKHIPSVIVNGNCISQKEINTFLWETYISFIGLLCLNPYKIITTWPQKGYGRHYPMGKNTTRTCHGLVVLGRLEKELSW
jgi:hypothetical protein